MVDRLRHYAPNDAICGWSLFWLPLRSVVLAGVASELDIGETGVKSNKKCIRDSVAQGKQPMQLFHGSFRTSMLCLFSESECFRI